MPFTRTYHPNHMRSLTSSGSTWSDARSGTNVQILIRGGTEKYGYGSFLSPYIHIDRFYLNFQGDYAPASGTIYSATFIGSYDYPFYEENKDAYIYSGSFTVPVSATTSNWNGYGGSSVTGIASNYQISANIPTNWIQRSSDWGLRLAFLSYYDYQNTAGNCGVSMEDKTLDDFTLSVIYKYIPPKLDNPSVSYVKETSFKAWINQFCPSGALTTLKLYYKKVSDTSYSSKTVGTYSGMNTLSVSELLTGLASAKAYQFYWYAYNEDASNTSSTYYVMTCPYPPSNLSVTLGSVQNTYQLTWNSGSNAISTMIRYKLNSFPANTSDGTLIYFSNGQSYTHSVAVATGNSICYKAWSYAKDGSYDAYSWQTATASIAPGPDAVKNVTLDKWYSDLQTAFYEARDGDEIHISSNYVPYFSSYTCNVDINITCENSNLLISNLTLNGSSNIEDFRISNLTVNDFCYGSYISVQNLYIGSGGYAAIFYSPIKYASGNNAFVVLYKPPGASILDLYYVSGKLFFFNNLQSLTTYSCNLDITQCYIYYLSSNYSNFDEFYDCSFYGNMYFYSGQYLEFNSTHGNYNASISIQGYNSVVFDPNPNMTVNHFYINDVDSVILKNSTIHTSTNGFYIKNSDVYLYNTNIYSLGTALKLESCTYDLYKNCISGTQYGLIII